jgi:hypothetical protein
MAHYTYGNEYHEEYDKHQDLDNHVLPPKKRPSFAGQPYGRYL